MIDGYRRALDWALMIEEARDKGVPFSVLTYLEERLVILQRSAKQGLIQAQQEIREEEAARAHLERIKARWGVQEFPATAVAERGGQ
jgi:hypothetical protein